MEQEMTNDANSVDIGLVSNNTSIKCDIDLDTVEGDDYKQLVYGVRDNPPFYLLVLFTIQVINYIYNLIIIEWRWGNVLLTIYKKNVNQT